MKKLTTLSLIGLICSTFMATASAGGMYERERGHHGKHWKQGPPGPQGERGPRGPRGHTGKTGPQGERGETGPQGAQGVAGATGATGAKGDKGNKGDKGDTGLRGLAGVDGINGLDGSDAHINNNHYQATGALAFATSNIHFDHSNHRIQVGIGAGYYEGVSGGAISIAKQLRITDTIKPLLSANFGTTNTSGSGGGAGISFQFK